MRDILTSSNKFSLRLIFFYIIFFSLDSLLCSFFCVLRSFFYITNIFFRAPIMGFSNKLFSLSNYTIHMLFENYFHYFGSSKTIDLNTCDYIFTSILIYRIKNFENQKFFKKHFQYYLILFSIFIIILL